MHMEQLWIQCTKNINNVIKLSLGNAQNITQKEANVH